jgi:hypothetical protein
VVRHGFPAPEGESGERIRFACAYALVSPHPFIRLQAYSYIFSPLHTCIPASREVFEVQSNLQGSTPVTTTIQHGKPGTFWRRLQFRSNCLLLASGFCPLHSYTITGHSFFAPRAVRGKLSVSRGDNCPAEAGQGRLNPPTWRQLKGADHASPVTTLLQFNDRRLVN